MKIAVIKLKWKDIRRQVLNWRNKRRNDQIIKVNSVHERSVSILQKRYGYSRAQATSELKKHYSKAWLG